MCYGTKGPNIDTFGADLPECHYQTTAPGYETTEWAELDNDANVRKVQRGKPAEEIRAKLAVEIALKLKRSGPETG
jgi:hypothetical protein